MAKPLLLFSCLLLAATACFAQKDTADSKGLMNINILDDRDTLIEHLWVDSLHGDFAVQLEPKTQIVTFYKITDGKKLPKGQYKVETSIDRLDFEDLNGDGANEILISTAPNMNGNRWVEAFVYDRSKDSIIDAGDFSTDYKVDAIHKTIEVNYEGSQYMDARKTLYKWYGSQLVPEKQVVMAAKDIAKHDGVFYLEYYTNPTHDPDKLMLVSKDLYKEANKQLQTLWEDFFKN